MTVQRLARLFGCCADDLRIDHWFEDDPPPTGRFPLDHTYCGFVRADLAKVAVAEGERILCQALAPLDAKTATVGLAGLRMECRDQKRESIDIEFQIECYLDRLADQPGGPTMDIFADWPRGRIFFPSVQELLTAIGGRISPYRDLGAALSNVGRKRGPRWTAGRATKPTKENPHV